jgi:hypothetical protein
MFDLFILFDLYSTTTIVAAYSHLTTVPAGHSAPLHSGMYI